MGLFTPAWKGTDEAKAMAQIKNCTNQKTLKRIALEAPGLYRRIEAIKRLRDPADMQEAAFCDLPKSFFHALRDHWAWNDCKAFVIKHIEDRDTIYSLARSGAGAPYCLVDKLISFGRKPKELAIDPSLHYEVRRAAVQRIDSSETLHALTEKLIDRWDRTLALTAIRGIQDPEIRKIYCKAYETHDWVQAEQSAEQYGDHRYVTRTYACKYCGKTRTEEETYKF